MASQSFLEGRKEGRKKLSGGREEWTGLDWKARHISLLTRQLATSDGRTWTGFIGSKSVHFA